MSIGKCVIGFDFLLFSAIFYVIDNDGMFILTLIAALIHELGHLIAIKLCGAKIETIYLGMFGAKIEMKSYPIISYKREIAIALAGPFAGAIFGIILSYMGQFALAGISLVLTAFNLLPALPLDGGCVLKYTSLLFLDIYWQDKISKAGNALSAVLLIALCIYICTNFGVAPSLCVFTTFTASGFLKELFE